MGDRPAGGGQDAAGQRQRRPGRAARDDRAPKRRAALEVRALGERRRRVVGVRDHRRRRERRLRFEEPALRGQHGQRRKREPELEQPAPGELLIGHRAMVARASMERLRMRRGVRRAERADPPGRARDDHGARRAGAAPPRAVPDPARARGPRPGLHPGDPGDPDAAGGRPGRRAPAAPLRRGLLHRGTGAQAEDQADLAACRRTGARDDDRRRPRRARRDRFELAGMLRPRRGRLADRPHRGDRDRATPRRPPQHRHGRRGREPAQRRDRRSCSTPPQ